MATVIDYYLKIDSRNRPTTYNFDLDWEPWKPLVRPVLKFLRAMANLS